MHLRFSNAVTVTIILILISRLLIAGLGVNFCGDDGEQYLDRARMYAKYGVMWYSDKVSSVYHDAPVYPFFLALLLSLTHSEALTIKLAVIMNSFLFAIAALGIYYLAFLLFQRRKVAYAALVIFGLLPEGIAYSVVYVPDSLFLAVFIWAQYLIVRYVREGRISRFLWGFFLMGMSVLIKPIALFFPLVLLPAILFFIRRLRFNQRVGLFLLGIFIEILVVSPWMIRNKIVSGKLAISTKMDFQLFFIHYGGLLAELGHEKIHYGRLLVQQRGYEKAIETLKRQENELRAQCVSHGHLSLLEQNACLGAFARKQIISHLPQYLVMVIKYHPRLYFGTGTVQLLVTLGQRDYAIALLEFGKSPSLSAFLRLPAAVIILQFISWIWLLIIYIFALFGFGKMLYNKEWFAATVLIAAFLYFSAVIGPVGYTRYRFDMSWVYCIFAGLTYYRRR